jgi:LPS-assembly lipoprotein
MWSSEPSRRRFLGLLAAPGLLAACGFTPLYGTGAPAAAMAGRVEVVPVPGGPGFALYERLTGRLGPATAPTHRLEVALGLERAGVALTQENVTTRYDVIGTADYLLVPLAGGPPVAQGTVRAITGYSAPANPSGSAFAVRAAEQDAERRLAVDLADQIVQRLAVGAGDWA